MKKTITMLVCVFMTASALTANAYDNLKMSYPQLAPNCGQVKRSITARPYGVQTSTIATQKYEIILNYKGQTFPLKFPEFKQSQNYQIATQSTKWGRDGNHDEAVFALSSLISMGVAPSIAFEFLFPTINSQIDTILAKVNVLPKDSKIQFTPNFSQKFWVSHEKIGYVIDKENLFRQIFAKFKSSPQVAITMHADAVEPQITREKNLQCTKLLSRFSTSIANSTTERQSNVRLALKQFNGMVIAPHTEVSFNATTGRRTEDKGYKSAHIISNGLFVDGVGGGVCQASTTLYNSLLLADNVEILEANRHSMPVSYVTLGFDAMVAFGSSDLKFKNTADTPIFIRTYYDNGRVYAEIYGKPERENTRKVRRSETISVIKNKGDIVKRDDGEFTHLLDENGYYRQKRAQDGYEVQTYLDTYIGTKLIESRPVRHTTYPPQQGILVRGTPPQDPFNQPD